MLDSVMSDGLTVSAFFLSSAVSLLLGVGVAAVAWYRSESTKGFLVTLAILPVVVQLIIMLVNGNLGAGVAVAGAFSLVRFRSAPGGAREIGALFLAMAIGLATGMGYLLLAAIVFVLVSAVLVLLITLRIGETRTGQRTLKITIPENLDYEGLFDDLLATYTRTHSLVRVRTCNMGTLYELEYRVTLPGDRIPKEFLDAIRCRNGNLTVSCGRELPKESL